MTETKLVAEKRAGRGKAEAKRMRRTKRVPAIIYGEIKEPIPISVDAHELDLLLKKSYSTIDIELDSKKHQVILRDIQRHPVNDTVLHVDFMQVKKGHKITMTVPVHFEGEAVGLKQGGVMDEVKRELEIAVLPKDIPEYIVANIENLNVGDAFRVKDLEAVNFEILDDPEDVLCRIEAPRVIATEAEGAEEEAMAEEEATEPEVITAKDKEEGESEG